MIRSTLKRFDPHENDDLVPVWSSSVSNVAANLPIATALTLNQLFP